eukprot:TRINITY_DN16768_c0_g1_i1.p1 TRINITY_DN16768_c0_g1~~TRINITY_DN16768_c0_g1_i1.p1  ORF type:complete len:199 (+),score=4.23 TRINITY_DN16768_c0_g1_i1:104-700(+)
MQVSLSNTKAECELKQTLRTLVSTTSTFKPVVRPKLDCGCQQGLLLSRCPSSSMLMQNVTHKAENKYQTKNPSSKYASSATTSSPRGEVFLHTPFSDVFKSLHIKEHWALTMHLSLPNHQRVNSFLLQGSRRCLMGYCPQETGQKLESQQMKPHSLRCTRKRRHPRNAHHPKCQGVSQDGEGAPSPLEDQEASSATPT